MDTDEIMRVMREAKPSWQDEKGIRGDPVMYHRDVSPTSFPKSQIAAEPSRIVTAPPPTAPSAKLPLGGDLVNAVN